MLFLKLMPILIKQDLRKGRLNGGVLELLDQVICEHPMLDLINRSDARVRDGFASSGRFQAGLEQSAGNMIALNAGYATLTGFHPCQLL